MGPGTFADMIAVEGDPLADVRVLESVAGVIKGGAVSVSLEPVWWASS
jgi:imidazolonepropionase-like amidohydrolase